MKYKIKWIRMIPIWAYGTIEVDKELTSKELDKIWDCVKDNPEAYFEHHTFFNAGDVPDQPHEDQADQDLFIEVDGKWEHAETIFYKLEEKENGKMSFETKTVDYAISRINEIKFPAIVNAAFGMKQWPSICNNETELKESIEKQLIDSYIGTVRIEWEIK